MPDQELPADPHSHRPSGPPRFAWFDGILEGPRGDTAAMQAVLARLEAASGARADLDEDGPRFTVILDDATIPGDKMGAEALETIARHLQELLDLLPAEGAVESTLRCTQIHQHEALEVLFAPQGRELHCVGRARPLTPQDSMRLPRRTSTLEDLNISRRKGLLLGVLLLVIFVIVAWQGGWVDAFLSADPDELTIQMGPFEDLLLLQVEREWGSYKLTIVRGQSYPISANDVKRLQAESETNAERAAVNAVADGDQVYVRLEDEQGKVLESLRVELRALVSKADAKIKLSLHGRMNAALLHVALDSGSDQK